MSETKQWLIDSSTLCAEATGLDTAGTDLDGSPTSADVQHLIHKHGAASIPVLPRMQARFPVLGHVFPQPFQDLSRPVSLLQVWATVLWARCLVRVCKHPTLRLNCDLSYRHIKRSKVTMVMRQILIGLALKARNDQPFGPARRRAIHAFLSERRGRKGGGEEEGEER